MKHRLIKPSVAAALFLAAAVVAWQSRGALRTGEEGTQVFFYDESEKRLYAAPGDTVAPDHGIGGNPDDGVRAIVVANRADAGDPAKRRIAYLETHTPEIKQRLQQALAAHRSRRPAAPAMTRDDPALLGGTLVRTLDENKWHAVNIPEGRKVIADWRTNAGAESTEIVVCTP